MLGNTTPRVKRKHFQSARLVCVCVCVFVQVRYIISFIPTANSLYIYVTEAAGEEGRITNQLSCSRGLTDY